MRNSIFCQRSLREPQFRDFIFNFRDFRGKQKNTTNPQSHLFFCESPFFVRALCGKPLFLRNISIFDSSKLFLMTSHYTYTSCYSVLIKTKILFIFILFLIATNNIAAACADEQAQSTISGNTNYLIAATLIDSMTTPGVCHGSTDGAIYFIIDVGGQTFTATNGWTVQSDTVFLSGLQAGSYSTFIQSATGDTLTINYSIADYPLPSAAINFPNSRLSDCGYPYYGYFSAFISGGTPPYSVVAPFMTNVWAAGDSVFGTDLVFGNYYAPIIDSLGCEGGFGFYVGETDFICGRPVTPLCAGIDGTEVIFTYIEDDWSQNHLWGVTGLPNPNIYYGFPYNEVQFFNVMPGTYTVTLIDDAMCPHPFTFTVGQSNLQMNSAVTPTTCIGCTNGEISLSNITGYNAYYTVSIDPGFPISGDTISNLPAGTYSVCINDSLNCTLCDTLTVLEDPSIVSSTSAEKIPVYPNPTNNICTITLPEKLSEAQIINSAGEIIPAHYHQNGNQLIFDTTGLANGIYFIQFMREGKVAERVSVVVGH